jgi:phosphodiesterase/alkaline phosphatase D-like protein
MQDMLGPAQWAWLERILRETEAELTVIGSGIQVRADGKRGQP